jgi:hypothetical protein
MAQQGKQKRLDVSEGFVHHSVKLVLLANISHRYDVDPIVLSGKTF